MWTCRTVLAAGILAAGVLATGAAAAADDPVRGGTLVQLVPVEPPTFDCHATQTSFVMQAVGPAYSGLVKFSTENYPEIVPDLAKSWDVSADGLTYTFHLRDGVKFHDGSTFDAEDVRATYERIIHPGEGIISVRQSDFRDVESIEVVDPMTVAFHLSDANVAMMNNFANSWNCIYSAEKLAENPRYPETEVMGTGPFKLSEYVKGSHWSMVRNDDYFVKGLPYLDGIRTNFVGGPAMINALAAGQADAMFWLLTPQDVNRIESSRGKDAVFDRAPMNSIVYVTLNASKPPFDDVRVRQALNLSIDRYRGDEAMSRVSAMKGATAYFAPGAAMTSTPEELGKLPGYSHDIDASREEARKLLKEAGKENLKITVVTRNLPPFEPPTIFAIDQFRKIGVDVEVVKLDTPAYFAALNKGEFEAAVEAYNFGTMDPNDVFPKFLPGSSTNYARNKDPELVSLFAAQRAETDPAARRDLAQKFQARLLQEAYYLPILWNERVTVRSAKVHGWHVTPVFTVGADLAEVWMDKAD